MKNDTFNIEEVTKAGRQYLNDGNFRYAADEVWFLKIINSIQDFWVEDTGIKTIKSLLTGGMNRRVRAAYLHFYDLYIDFLKQLPYSEYLRTSHWQKIRKEKLDSVNYICELCHTKNTKVDVHHRHYETKGNESLDDLIVFCRECHLEYHKKTKQ